MKFTPASGTPIEKKTKVEFMYADGKYWVSVYSPSLSDRDAEIRAAIVEAGYEIEQNRGDSYTIKGGLYFTLEKLFAEVRSAYCEVEDDRKEQKINAIVKLLLLMDSPDERLDESFSAREMAKYDDLIGRLIPIAEQIIKLFEE